MSRPKPATVCSSWGQRFFAKRWLLRRTTKGVQNSGPHARRTPSVYVPTTFPTRPRLKTASGIEGQTLAMLADRRSDKLVSHQPAATNRPSANWIRTVVALPGDRLGGSCTILTNWTARRRKAQTSPAERARSAGPTVSPIDVNEPGIRRLDGADALAPQADHGPLALKLGFVHRSVRLGYGAGLAWQRFD